MDACVKMQLRFLLRKRSNGQGRGHGLDHIRWPNRYFKIRDPMMNNALRRYRLFGWDAVVSDYSGAVPQHKQGLMGERPALAARADFWLSNNGGGERGRSGGPDFFLLKLYAMRGKSICKKFELTVKN